MIEIEYIIGDVCASMVVSDNYPLLLTSNGWVSANQLTIGEKIVSRNGDLAFIKSTIKIVQPQPVSNLRTRHNHHYFVTKETHQQSSHNDTKAPSDLLELIPYRLANKPSKHPNGESTGDHAGPWAAARYKNTQTGIETIGWGRASDTMCAEDAAVHHLRCKLGHPKHLHRGNVEISHSYVRKYSRKGRLVNTIHPCRHCRNIYGSALKDITMGTSHLLKSNRGYLRP